MSEFFHTVHRFVLFSVVCYTFSLKGGCSIHKSRHFGSLNLEKNTLNTIQQLATPCGLEIRTALFSNFHFLSALLCRFQQVFRSLCLYLSLFWIQTVVNSVNMLSDKKLRGKRPKKRRFQGNQHAQECSNAKRSRSDSVSATATRVSVELEASSSTSSDSK